MGGGVGGKNIPLEVIIIIKIQKDEGTLQLLFSGACIRVVVLTGEWQLSLSTRGAKLPRAMLPLPEEPRQAPV